MKLISTRKSKRTGDAEFGLRDSFANVADGFTNVNTGIFERSLFNDHCGFIFCYLDGNVIGFFDYFIIMIPNDVYKK